MPEVRLLEKTVAERIAAGEVVERPASVIKELVENSLDAASSKICVDVRGGGAEFMQIVDDGCGMSRQDVQMAIQRFATSKISQWEDLNSLATMGFRGEALPSVAAVSRLTIRTCCHGSLEGTELTVEGGGDPVVKPAAAIEGTRITVRDLFFNTPARLKFLRSASAETAQISDLLGRIAAAWPEVHFELNSNGKSVFAFPSGVSSVQRLAAIWKTPVEAFIPICLSSSSISVDGWVCLPSFARATRNYQLFLLNGRLIRSQNISQAMLEGFAPLVERGRFPVGMIRLSIDPSQVDVNVHPNKMEVRFVDPRPIFSLVCRAVSEALAKNQADSVRPSHLWMAADEDKSAQCGSAEQFKWSEPRALKTLQLQHSAAQQASALTRLSGHEARPVGGSSQAQASHRDLDLISSTEPFALSASSVQAELELDSISPICRSQVQDQTEDFSAGVDKPASLAPSAAKQALWLWEPPASTEPCQLAGQGRFRPLAQLYNTFIVGLVDGELWLIDQHTAHERINYERLGYLAPMDQRSQGLLIPEVVELSFAGAQLVKEQAAAIEALGFQLEPFGGQAFRLTGVPAGLGTGSLAHMSMDRIVRSFKDLVDELGEGVGPSKNSVAESVKERMRAMASCKAAVKAGEALSPDDMRSLVETMLTVEHSLYCPHGRPTRVRLDQKSLERLFHR